jgi:hypothetical protein
MMADYGWISSISSAIGALSLFIMLYKAKSAKESDDFSSLPMYMFYCLSAVAGAIIVAIVFFPIQFEGVDLPVARTLQNGNGTQWVINIGGVNQAGSLGIQVPLFIIILGTLGSYVRYLYLGIPEFKTRFKRSFKAYQRIESRNANQIKWIDNILKNFPEPDQDAPQIVKAAYAREKDGYILQKNKLEGVINEKRYELTFDVSNDFLRTAGLFLLGPLLAVMAWLILQISGTQNDLVFAVASLTVGFTASSIIRRARSIVEDRISDSEEKQKAPVISLEKNVGRSGKKVAITGSGFDSESTIQMTLGDSDVMTDPSEINTNASGTFSAKFVVPDIKVGEYKLKVEDDEGNKAATQFKVIAASLTLDKIQEKANMIITATGRDFASNSIISLSFDDQRLVTDPPQVETDVSGSFSAKFIVPPSKAGDHKVTATDSEGDSVSTTFTISP